MNGTEKAKGFPTQRPSATNFALQITVNGTPLFSKLTLVVPSDASDFFSYQISPDLVPTLRQQTGCYIKAADITSAQQAAGQ